MGDKKKMPHFIDVQNDICDPIWMLSMMDAKEQEDVQEESLKRHKW